MWGFKSKGKALKGNGVKRVRGGAQGSECARVEQRVFQRINVSTETEWVRERESQVCLQQGPRDFQK